MNSSIKRSATSLPEKKVDSIPHTRVDDDKFIENLFSMGRKLGQGSFGIVREAKDKKSGRRWAVKAVNKEKAGSSAVQLLEREVMILKRVNHEHIIHLERVFETSKRVYLVMELCEHGELADLLKQKQHFTEAQGRYIITDLAGAISYLHKNDIVHRDLKLENILVKDKNENGHLHIKVTDFGLSVVKHGIGHEHMLQQFCGTPIYMPPEIVDNKTYSHQCDVWAMGVIAYHMLAGVPPFTSRDELKLYELIKKALVKFDAPHIKSCSKDAHHCIGGMLKADPAHRFTASEILDHKWITGVHQESPTSNVLVLMKQWKHELSEKRDGISDSPPEALDDSEVPKITSPDRDQPTTEQPKSPSSSSNTLKSSKIQKSPSKSGRLTAILPGTLTRHKPLPMPRRQSPVVFHHGYLRQSSHLHHHAISMGTALVSRPLNTQPNSAGARLQSDITRRGSQVANFKNEAKFQRSPGSAPLSQKSNKR